MSATFRIGDEEIKYKVKRGNSSKYLNLKLKPNLELEVILPGNSKVDVNEILQKKRAWVEKKYKELLRKERILSNERILYKGERYDIKVICNVDSSNIELDEKTRTITIYVVNRNPILTLKKWMTNKTRSYVQERANKYAEALRVRFDAIYVRSMKKWGSCTKRRNLSFNWQLIALPEKLAEYVIIHEITHLVDFNHLKAFRTKIISLCPDYMERDRALKNYLFSFP